MTTLTKENILALGGKEWIKNDMERVYMSNEVLNKVLEEKGLDTVNYGERNNKIFFDCKTGNIMRSYKGKKPKIEVEGE